MTQSDIGIVELRSCPFCGSEPKVDNYGSGACVRIYCEGENCTPYPSVRKYANGDALERATAAWNTRDPIITEMVEALEAFTTTAVISEHTHSVSVDEWVLSKARAVLAKVRSK